MKLVSFFFVCFFYPFSLCAFVTSTSNHPAPLTALASIIQDRATSSSRQINEEYNDLHLNYNKEKIIHPLMSGRSMDMGISTTATEQILDTRGGGFVIDLNLFKKPIGETPEKGSSSGPRKGKLFSITRTRNQYAQLRSRIGSSAPSSVILSSSSPTTSSSTGKLSAVVASSVGEKLPGRNPFLALWKAYEHQMTVKPILTKIVTSSVLCGFGDILSQVLTSSKASFTLDLKRVVIFAGIGGAYLGPTLHLWYNLLEKVATSKVVAPLELSKSKVKKTAAMLLIDQTFGAYFVNGGMLFCIWFFTDLFNGISPLSLLMTLPLKVIKEMPATMLACWKMWPLANGINFAFVPLQYRLLFTNVVAIIWNVFMSMVVNK